ncbi:hypothetical protein ACH5RR_006827 [Cinchona calisaya]|uniref:RNase H type-1 domain-containing protein n=1 Tax=Cinchona calisaya TaxID=153742 RepID=A0ABD3AQ58_9GENT
MQPTKALEVLHWLKLSHNYFKLNLHGSSIGNLGPLVGGEEGGGQDHLGLIIFGFTKYFGVGTSLEAELKSLLHGITLCLSKNLFPLHVEIDSKLVVDMITKRVNCP